MKLLRMTLHAALRALRRNKMRSILTMLGIIIGVAAVIAMVSVGQGANVAVQKQIESLGTNLLMVDARVDHGRRRPFGMGRRVHSDSSRRGRHQARMPSRQRGHLLSPPRRAGHLRQQELVYDRPGHHTGVRSGADWNTSAGSFFTARDDATANRVVVIGQTVATSCSARAKIPSAPRSASSKCLSP